MFCNVALAVGSASRGRGTQRVTLSELARAEGLPGRAREERRRRERRNSLPKSQLPLVGDHWTSNGRPLEELSTSVLSLPWSLNYYTTINRYLNKPVDLESLMKIRIGEFFGS